jgi:hypothetical protein
LYGASALALGALVAACSAASSLSSTPSHDDSTSSDELAQSCATPIVPVTTSRSLFVASVDDSGSQNDWGIAALKNFSFSKVLNQVVATGAQGSGQTSEKLWEQLISEFAAGTCSDTINGYPVYCPRPEALLDEPGCEDAGTCEELLQPVALVNRFDLAPADGANCGQYRIVFTVPIDQLPPHLFDFLINFEAVLPNPTPSAGLAGCFPVAQFWDQLSSSTLSEKDYVDRLQSFYFKGIPAGNGHAAFGPVIDAFNYGIGAPGNTNTGQLRINAQGGASGSGGPLQWQLRELRLSQACAEGACTLTANNTFVQDNPYGGLFNVSDAGAAGGFQTEFLSQVASLAGSDPNLVSMTTPNVDNAGQSNEQDESNDYAVQAGLRGGQFPPNTALETNLQNALTKIGSSLTPENILDRATSQSCAGCHALSPNKEMGGPDGGFKWPASLGFLQVSPNGNQSPALTGTFLPFRKQVLTSYLQTQCNGGDAGASDPAHTVGGRLVGSSD